MPRSSSRSKSASVKCRPAVGRRDRALVLRIDGLVIDQVLLVGRPLAGDVRRQRQLAETRDGLIEERPGECEAKHDLAALLLLDHFGIEAHQLARRALGSFAEADAVADRELFRRSREGAPAVGGSRACAA